MFAAAKKGSILFSESPHPSGEMSGRTEGDKVHKRGMI